MELFTRDVIHREQKRPGVDRVASLFFIYIYVHAFTRAEQGRNPYLFVEITTAKRLHASSILKSA